MMLTSTRPENYTDGGGLYLLAGGVIAASRITPTGREGPDSIELYNNYLLGYDALRLD